MKKYPILLFLVLLTGFAVAQSKQDKTTIAKLDATFQKAIADFNVPGMAIAIVKDGKVILAKGYGVKDVRTNEPVTENTSFAIASNSKAFTAAALATLVDEGKISWDDKVKTYLPYFELYSPYVSEEMTIRDLLCHRSGLATFSGDLIWYGTNHSREEVIKRAKFLEPVYGFRENYGYSNIMFLAAGEIIPVVTGKSWDEYIAEKFFTPLAMTNANTSITQFKLGQDIATPHNEKDGVNIAIEYVNWDNIAPAGSINASVANLSQWIQLQLGKGSLNGQKYWSEQRTYEMWENYTPKSVGAWQRKNMPTRHFNGYGLGWELMEYGGQKIVSHGGGYDGMISKTVLIPEKNIGFVILTNNINSLPSALSFSILDAFLEVKETQDWPALFLKFKKDDEANAPLAAKEKEESRLKNTQPSLPLEAYCGTYESEMYGAIEISLNEQNSLNIDFKPTALFKGTLSHWHLDTFQLNWSTQMMLPSGEATFIINKNGNVEELRIVVDNPDFDFSELKLMKK